MFIEFQCMYNMYFNVFTFVYVYILVYMCVYNRIPRFVVMVVEKKKKYIASLQVAISFLLKEKKKLLSKTRLFLHYQIIG